MDKRLVELHTKAGIVCGQQKTCGKKVRYNTEETATKSAKKLFESGKSKYELEPYPCPFCTKWHIGRKMAAKELEKWEKIFDEGDYKIIKCTKCGKILFDGELRLPYDDGPKCSICYMEECDINKGLDVGDKMAFQRLIKEWYYTSDPERYQKAMERIKVEDDEMFAYFDKLLE